MQPHEGQGKKNAWVVAQACPQFWQIAQVSSPCSSTMVNSLIIVDHHFPALWLIPIHHRGANCIKPNTLKVYPLPRQDQGPMTGAPAQIRCKCGLCFVFAHVVSPYTLSLSHPVGMSSPAKCLIIRGFYRFDSAGCTGQRRSLAGCSERQSEIDPQVPVRPQVPEDPRRYTWHTARRRL